MKHAFIQISACNRFQNRRNYAAMLSISRLFVVVLFGTVSLYAGDLHVITLRHRSAKGILPSVPPPSEEALYVHGMAQRAEFIGYVDGFQGPPGQAPPHMAVISHCDTGVGYQIDLDHHEYRQFNLPKYPSQQQFDKQVAQSKKEAEKHIKSEIQDTGETRHFHTYTARHFITTIKTKYGPNQSQTTIDGWYVDLPEPGCAPEYVRRGRGAEVELRQEAVISMITPRVSALPQPPPPVVDLPRTKFVYTGFVPDGWVVQEKSVTHYTLERSQDEIQGDNVTEREVVDFSESPVDPSLFEVPSGFVKVKQLYKHTKPTGN